MHDIIEGLSAMVNFGICLCLVANSNIVFD